VHVLVYINYYNSTDLKPYGGPTVMGSQVLFLLKVMTSSHWSISCRLRASPRVCEVRDLVGCTASSSHYNRNASNVICEIDLKFYCYKVI